MKIKVNNPQPEDIRIISKYLLLPLRINDELRWLERVKIKQRFETVDTWDLGWANICFIDE